MLIRIILSVIILTLTPSFSPGLFSLAHATDLSLFSTAEQEWISLHPTVRIRISQTYPPFEFYADQQYQGIAYDYLQLVSEKTGIDFEPVDGLTWSESLDALRKRRGLDMVLLITHTKERESFLVFTDDYVSFDWVIIRDKTNTDLQDFSGLNKKTVAVEKGFISADWLQRDIPEVKLLEVGTTLEALQAVSQGDADAYIGNLATAAWTIDQEGLINLKVIGVTPYGEDAMAMGVRKDWPELAHIVNTVLNSIPDDVHQQIRNRWLPVSYDYEYELPNILFWTGGILLVALLWILQLRLIVRRRTSSLQEEIDLRREKEVELQMSMEYLNHTHQRLRFNIDRMPLGYIVWDNNFAVQEWNPAAEKIFGWSEEEARGKQAYELIVPTVAKDAVALIWTALIQGDDTSSSINENKTKDGKRLICSWYNAPLRDSEGNVYGALSMVEDITQRHEQERAREQQFEQLSKIFDSINALVYVADMETYELIYLNQLGMEIFGKEWKGRKCYEFLQADQTGVCSFCTNDKLIVDGEATLPYIWEFQNSLNKRWYQCIDRAIPWISGDLVRMEIAFDITESKTVEQLKDQMVSAVSHEMRTPLTAVLGYVEYLMSNQVSPEETQEHIRTIYSEAERLSDLIDSFLNLQQLKDGQEPLSFFAVDVCAVLTDIRTSFAQEDSCHEIVIDCPENLPCIKVDTLQVREAVCQVVANAIKYSPAGGRISLSARQSGPMIEISIADQGIGIPGNLLDKIFDRFYRVDNSDTRQFGGVGIGLTLVHDIVSIHGGQVRAESSEGEGTTVTLSFPVFD